MVGFEVQLSSLISNSCPKEGSAKIIIKWSSHHEHQCLHFLCVMVQNQTQPIPRWPHVHSRSGYQKMQSLNVPGLVSSHLSLEIS